MFSKHAKSIYGSSILCLFLLLPNLSEATPIRTDYTGVITRIDVVEYAGGTSPVPGLVSYFPNIGDSISGWSECGDDFTCYGQFFGIENTALYEANFAFSYMDDSVQTMGMAYVDMSSFTFKESVGWYLDSNSITIYGYIDSINGQPVPEPATLLLFGSGLTGLVVARRRKK